MAGSDAGSGVNKPSRRQAREEISAATVSIMPIPVEQANQASAEPEHEAYRPAPVVPPKPAQTIRPQSQRPVPSRMVAKYLFASERYAGEWRRHWIHVLGWLIVGILSPFVVGYVVGLVGNSNPTAMWIILGVWLVLLGFVTWALVDWWLERFILTNKRVMLVSGLISRRVAMMPLARVTDMAYVQSPLGMMLNYGTFVLESAGQDQALREIKPLPHPNDLYLLFCQEMYDPDAIDEGSAENAPEGDVNDH